MGEYVTGQGARLRCLRDYLGLSVSEIAAVLDVSPRSYQSFESGRAAIPEGVMAEVRAHVHRLDEKAGEFAQAGTVSLYGLSRFDLRALSIAVAANDQLQLTPL